VNIHTSALGQSMPQRARIQDTHAYVAYSDEGQLKHSDARANREEPITHAARDRDRCCLELDHAQSITGGGDLMV
jgi:hypothetical protein